MSAIEAAAAELKKKVKSTRGVVVARYTKEEAKNHEKSNGKANEDQEMEGVEMEDANPVSSFKDMNKEPTTASNAPAASKTNDKGKNNALVQFGDLPYVGGKKGEGQEKKKEHDEDAEWKKYFLK
jgi:hypothetical protein